MSFQLMAWAAEQTTGSPTRKAVLMALANAANHHSGKCCPSVEEIANETEYSEPTVRRALKELADSGLISRKRRRRGDGSLGVYDFTFPTRSEREHHRSERALDHRSERAGKREPGTSEPGVETEAAPLPLPASAADAAPPKLLKIDGRDIAFDKLAEVCGIEEGSNRMREVGMALNGGTAAVPTGIRALFWREVAEAMFETAGGAEAEDFERSLVHEIPMRASMYRIAMGEAILTPFALAKWWTDLPKLAREQGSALGMSPEQILEATREFERGLGEVDGP